MLAVVVGAAVAAVAVTAAVLSVARQRPKLVVGGRYVVVRTDRIPRLYYNADLDDWVGLRGEATEFDGLESLPLKIVRESLSLMKNGTWVDTGGRPVAATAKTGGLK